MFWYYLSLANGHYSHTPVLEFGILLVEFGIRTRLGIQKMGSLGIYYSMSEVVYKVRLQKSQYFSFYSTFSVKNIQLWSRAPKATCCATLDEQFTFSLQVERKPLLDVLLTQFV